MTASGIPALLEPIQERLDAATPGPWNLYRNDREVNMWVLSGDGALECNLGYLGNRPENDAVFIAAAPTDTARLLAAVKAVADLADAWQARGDHLLKYAAENRFPDGVAESLSESGAEFVHSAKLVRSAVEAALRGEA